MNVDVLISEILALPHHEKVQVLDAVLRDLDKYNRETKNIWTDEARKRGAMYKAGQLQTVSYEHVIGKYRTRM